MSYSQVKASFFRALDTALDVASYVAFPLFIAKTAVNIIAPLPKAEQSKFTDTIITKPLLSLFGTSLYGSDLPKEDRKYVENWMDYLTREWGIDNDFSEKAAEFIIKCSKAGLNPTMSSGYRSTAKQKDLYARWLKGEPGIYTPAIPGTSPHERTTWYGQPAAKCFDLKLNNYYIGAVIASKMNLSYGYPNDPVHFGDMSLA
jgi:hypothetical protein